MRPSSCESVMRDVGHLLAQDLRRLLLACGGSGEKTVAMPTARIPGIADALRRVADALAVERHERPAVELVAALDHAHVGRAPVAAQIVGPVDEGRQEALAGRPMRSAATRSRSAAAPPRW